MLSNHYYTDNTAVAGLDLNESSNTLGKELNYTSQFHFGRSTLKHRTRHAGLRRSNLAPIAGNACILAAVFPPSVISLPWYMQPVFATAAGALFLLGGDRSSERSSERIIRELTARRIARLLAIPFALGCIWTYTMMILGLSDINRIFRPASMLVQSMAILFMSCGFYVEYGQDAPLRFGALLLAVSLICFTTGTIVNGWTPVHERLLSRGNGVESVRKYFELHDIGNCMPLLAAYFMTIDCHAFRKGKAIVPFLLIVSFICYKRIALAAGALAMILSLVISPKKASLPRGLTFSEFIVHIGVFSAVVGWIIVCSSGNISQMFTELGIESSGRGYMWDFFSNNFPGTVQGHGSGFTGIVLNNMVGTRINAGHDMALALHNDLLRILIEFGYLGACFWICYHTLFVSTSIGKTYGPRAKRTWLIVFSFACVSYATSNTLRAVGLQTTLFLIICAVADVKLLQEASTPMYGDATVTSRYVSVSELGDQL